MFILIKGNRAHRPSTPETAAEIAQSTVDQMELPDENTRAIATEAAYIAAEIALELRDSKPLVDLTATHQPTIFEGVTQ